MNSLLQRGKAQKDQRDREIEANRRYQIEEGQRQIRKSFVFHFYEDTLVNDRGMRVLGPESPDPEIAYEGEIGWMGGSYHNVPWTWTHEGIDWRMEYEYSRLGGWDLNFSVRNDRKWHRVYGPRSVYEVFA